ncbi:hypothetical protein JOL62DRAFT_559570 [Phyllosticta paracitricarpa]|uniref:Uncharacterized protein n=1 Tax=Phyllosticta paracitricarpa TaxID=2016321 RepID=A0ABR1MWF7_9PEZI
MSEKADPRPREDPVPEIEEIGRSASVLTDTHVETASVERPNEQYRNIFGPAIETGTDLPGGNAVYNAKVQLLNEALLDVGMGRMSSFEFIQPAVKQEATFYAEHKTHLAVSHLMLVIMGFAGLVGAGMSAFSGLCVVSFFMGIAAGGNQSIGGAILIEILPSSHQYLLTVQGIFSALGKFLTTAFAFTITLFLCLVRFCFHLHETPKYLLAQGRDVKVVKTVRSPAVYRSKRSWLSPTHLRKIEEDLEDTAEAFAAPVRGTALGVAGLRRTWIQCMHVEAGWSSEQNPNPTHTQTVNKKHSLCELKDSTERFPETPISHSRFSERSLDVPT